MDNYWTNRRTIRKFTDREVPQSLLTEIIEEAAHAPTTGTMQLYSAVITRDPMRLAQLCPAHFNQPAATGAPVLVTFCADWNRFVKWCEASGADPAYDNFQSLMSAILDTAIFAQQFNTIAEQRGLGCCYLGTTTYNAPQIAEALNLPPMVVPVTTLAVGFPADQGTQTYRLPVEAIMHSETYLDKSPADIRSQYYAEIENRPDCKGFVDEHNKESLAQVFTDVRYPRANNVAFSKIFYDFIAQAGFPWPAR